VSEAQGWVVVGGCYVLGVVVAYVFYRYLEATAFRPSSPDSLLEEDES